MGPYEQASYEQKGTKERKYAIKLAGVLFS